jgi:hypothetical protein
VCGGLTTLIWEVELLLRSSLSPHRAVGYEVNFRCSKTKYVVGNVITAYLNGHEMLHASDSSYPRGSPSTGFYFESRGHEGGESGFTEVAATDGAFSVDTFAAR